MKDDLINPAGVIRLSLVGFLSRRMAKKSSKTLNVKLEQELCSCEEASIRRDIVAYAELLLAIRKRINREEGEA